MKLQILTLVFFFMSYFFAQTKYPKINNEIIKGNFSKAIYMMKLSVADTDSKGSNHYDLQFLIDVLDRIKKDFSKSEKDIVRELKKYYPNLDRKQFEQWENDKLLEMRFIDGEKKYFKNAVPNFFRKNLEAKKVKEQIDGVKKDKLKEFLSFHLPAVLKETEKKSKRIIAPVKMKLKYTLTVRPNAVPGNEIIRCWLPFPRINNRQKDIKLISVNSPNYIIADSSNQQRTIYLEQMAVQGYPTKFEIELSYTSYSEFINYLKIKKEIVFDTNSTLFKEFTSERPPHIVFTDTLKKLAQKIIGEEKNTVKKIQLIYDWIDDNIPWTSALEYSTIDNISNYCIDNRQGDCGIKTLLFMTLCRLNGIPCKWQSGWMLHPEEVNLHDWCEIYLEGFGWIPVDQSFGKQESDNENIKYFFLQGIDSYRLIVNDDYSRPLFPTKIFPRSETVDFQRGEVEWKGGNLYFDKWNYNMEVVYLNEEQK